jgi:hypothetical protein
MISVDIVLANYPIENHLSLHVYLSIYLHFLLMIQILIRRDLPMSQLRIKFVQRLLVRSFYITSELIENSELYKSNLKDYIDSIL